MLRPPRNAGFTLIELLIVMGLILTLMALLFMAGMKYKSRASEEATRSLIQRLELNIQDYHTLMGKYPADGLDDETVETEEMQNSLYSSAALAYALAEPLTIISHNAGGERIETEREEGLCQFNNDELIRPDDDDPQMCEIVDAFGEGLHYDNLVGGFSPQDSAEVHLEEPDFHLGDPREDEDLVDEPGGQNHEKYDIWSHGIRGHTQQADLKNFIANFGNNKEGEDDGE